MYSFDDVIKEISELTHEDIESVKDKVWQEALNPGYNVSQDAIKYGIKFYTYDERMETLYKESSGFIIETVIASFRHWKQEIQKNMKQRIDNYLQSTNSVANVLMYGDGAGSDTIYLSECFGDKIKLYYFDVPGSKTFDFASNRFKRYNVQNIEFITKYEDIPHDFFDIIVCIEVLEHLPNPEDLIKDMSKWLKQKGIAIITEAFEFIEPSLPTHLKSNLKYVGKIHFLFAKYNLLLTYTANNLKPMEFTKEQNINLVDYLKLFFKRPVLRHYIKGYIVRQRKKENIA